MIQTLKQFKWHLLAILILVAIHTAIPLPGADTPSALPPDALKAIAKCDDDILKARRVLVMTLTKAQEKVLKSGNLDGANAIKEKITETVKLAGEDSSLLGESAPVSVKERLVGSFTYSFVSGHKGTLQVRKNEATIPGFTGNIASEGNTLAITWSNGTRWTVSDQDGELVAAASDGTCKLIRAK